MKIGKVTLDGYFNYGNVLQNYALNRVLEGYADTVETLWYTPKCRLPEYWVCQRPWNWKSYIKFIINWKGFRNTITTGLSDWEVYRNGRIKDFCDKNIHIRYVEDLADVSNEYDYFITGSDQVWNPIFGDLPNTFLTFAPSAKRFSYAASIAVPVVPQEKMSQFIEGVHDMAQLSVREADGARIIKDLTGRNATVHIDPTLLLTATEWKKIEEKPQWLLEDKPYIVTYFLGNVSDDIKKKISDKYGMPVINILDEKVFEHYTVSPGEWLYLIDNAKLVYTDSFHGVVFSIQFKTPFVVLDRVASCNMSSRIDTLLDLFNLENRRENNNYKIHDPYKCDFSSVEGRLESERLKAHSYLENIFR